MSSRSIKDSISFYDVYVLCTRKTFTLHTQIHSTHPHKILFTLADTVVYLYCVYCLNVHRLHTIGFVGKSPSPVESAINVSNGKRALDHYHQLHCCQLKKMEQYPNINFSPWCPSFQFEHSFHIYQYFVHRASSHHTFYIVFRLNNCHYSEQ